MKYPDDTDFGEPGPQPLIEEYQTLLFRKVLKKRKFDSYSDLMHVFLANTRVCQTFYLQYYFCVFLSGTIRDKEFAWA